MPKRQPKTSRDEVIELLSRLRVRYGPHKVDKKLWAQMLKEWAPELTSYDSELLWRGMTKAWRASPEWFPGLGEIIECCESLLPKPSTVEDDLPTEKTPEQMAEGKRRVREIVKSLEDEMSMEAEEKSA
jgi:hypothetical protein